ncbi:hypothetical protein [Streptomyces sp. NPDC057939]|uniref:hypothetical protein n=1 Tax=Streptomyces sp. NPDC057939 TaxID=3346284 RepID=UPI0036EC1159
MDHGTDSADRLTLIEAPIRNPPARILLLRGTVNWWDETALRTALTRASTAGDLPLIVDVGSIEHADAVLLGLLLHAHIRTRLHLVGPLSRSLNRRLDVTGTRSAFRIHPHLTAALTAITAADAPGG